MKKSQAFTLIEILVATSVFVIAMSIVAGITVTSTKAIARSMNTKKINGAVRDLNTRLTQELRNSSKVVVDGNNSNTTFIIGNGPDTKTLKVGADKSITLDGQSIVSSDVAVEAYDTAFSAPLGNIKLLTISLKISTKLNPLKTMDFVTSIACRK